MYMLYIYISFYTHICTKVMYVDIMQEFFIVIIQEI